MTRKYLHRLSHGSRFAIRTLFAEVIKHHNLLRNLPFVGCLVIGTVTSCSRSCSSVHCTGSTEQETISCCKRQVQQTNNPFLALGRVKWIFSHAIINIMYFILFIFYLTYRPCDSGVCKWQFFFIMLCYSPQFRPRHKSFGSKRVVQGGSLARFTNLKNRRSRFTDIKIRFPSLRK